MLSRFVCLCGDWFVACLGLVALLDLPAYIDDQNQQVDDEIYEYNGGDY